MTFMLVPGLLTVVVHISQSTVCVAGMAATRVQVPSPEMLATDCPASTDTMMVTTSPLAAVFAKLQGNEVS